MHGPGTRNPLLEEFHRERSKFLDGFASIEHAIVRLLEASKCRFGSECLGQKIDILRKAKPAPQYSKARKAKVNALLDQVEALLAMRADIVHARLAVVSIDDEHRACFINSRHVAALSQEARLVSLENLQKLTRQIGKLGTDLDTP